MKRLLAYLPLLYLLIASILAAAEVDFSASVDQSTVGLGDEFTLNLTVSGEDMATVPKPEVPAMPDFNVIGQTQSSSTNVAINNGQIRKESTVTFIYVLSAKKLGKLTIPGSTLKYGGKAYQSQPIEINVVKASQAQVAPQQRPLPGRAPQVATVPVGDNLFLLASADRKAVYLGEQVTLDFTFYARQLQIANANLAGLPSFGGFWTEKIFDATKFAFSRRTLNGKEYEACLLKKIAVFPMSTGDLKIDPMALNISVVRGPRDFFDMFGTTQNVRIESKPLTITALPLPDGKPKEFSGGVGQFAISSSLDRTATSDNEPFNLTIKISGTGNIRLIEKPLIPAIPGLKVLDPEVKDDIRASGDAIKGTRTFRYPIIPQTDGRFVIPAVSLAFFDPATKGYKTVSTEKYECTATGCTHGAPLVEATGLKVLGADINYIKPDARTLTFYPAGTAPWLFAVYALSLGLVGSSFWLRGYRDRLATDRGFARKTRSAGLVRQRLKAAERSLERNDLPDFYAALSQAVLGYAGDRYDIDAHALTKDELRERLVLLDIDPATADGVITVIEHCEIARFSPGLLSIKDPRELLEKTRTLLNRL